jgi:hypothetical protein
LAQLLQLHASFWVSLERPGHHQQQLYVFWLMLFLLLFLFVGMPEILLVFAK